LSLARILLRRWNQFTGTEIDIAEPFYDGAKKTIGVGDGTTNPPRMLTENNPQPVTNKTLDASRNSLSNISPTSFAAPQFSVAPLQGVVSSFPATGAIKPVAPVLDVNAVNVVNANYNELATKLNEVIRLLQNVKLSG